jgi:hypothetical protein
MRHGYVLGPLIALPLLGALFMVPQPQEEHPLSFPAARASVLECHIQIGGFLFAPFDPAVPLQLVRDDHADALTVFEDDPRLP